MFSAAALALAFTLTLHSALAAPTLRPGAEPLEKRQNAPLFGGWDKNQNVTGIIAELSEQPNPIDRDVLLPSDGLNFDFLSECAHVLLRNP